MATRAQVGKAITKRLLQDGEGVEADFDEVPFTGIEIEPQEQAEKVMGIFLGPPIRKLAYPRYYFGILGIWLCERHPIFLFSRAVGQFNILITLIANDRGKYS